ncbi:FAD-dependent oxidoreductase [Corynebacterium hylobatis]|uniref:FAD-dependent oxidoreductase n=1 Tax=Corynebacterium hylobatis TaxID=1859290 RepID=A0A3S0HH59_9CORY|nr:FAD-dependent oxidoreductase [Corynebacterium hylobatis]RSZ63450.1 FAD-dependent oxidoreductase [Corynebacterium hylobatis]
MTSSINSGRTCDVLVVGSGVAGLATALAAAHQGLDVIVAEQEAHFGGTAAISAGWAWVPGNPKGAAATGDTREEVETYLKALAPDTYNEAGVTAFLDTVAEAITFFEDNTEVNFVYPDKAPDYQMDLPGARIGGRAILPDDADARMLGERRHELQPYLSSYTVFGYMPQVGPDLNKVVQANRSLRAFCYVAGKLTRTWFDALVHRQPLKRTNGSALITRMVRSALDAGVTVWTATPVEALEQDDTGAITGAVLGGVHSGTVHARLGVVLAGGGFTGNTTLRRKHFPHDVTGDNHITPTIGHNGSSAEMAITAGGRISDAVFTPGSWAPVTEFRQLRDGRQRLFPHLRQIGLPGMITVDRTGRRFGNEALSYHDFGRQLLEHDKDHDDTYAWIIADAACMHTYGIGYAKPWPIPRKYFHDIGFLIKADTLAELAGKIGADPVTLEETVTRFNGFARSGVDEDFGRGSTAYNHFRGDPTHKPNPNLATLEKAPYYAVKIRMGDLGSFAGIDVDGHSAVIDDDGQVIPGLFAVGSAAVSVFGGGYPGYGSHIGPALIFGYRMGRDIARLKQRSASRAG